ncbi:unnamed protein product [Chondrus crispus]|uniref:Uncharacterized protein n=1 Tax=Chondrus crispus TaxID=2769 RepID=R7Q8Y9_CHOCR|nr:unnamed protein product [Chondrus crispus]CDF34499.1 unnamed protein product [Chondrus crispus]|eukprot:XP_005714318.1 unnamed protein product [Chondrus crispus]
MQTAGDKNSSHAVANRWQTRLIRGDAPEWSGVLKQPVREADLHRCKDSGTTAGMVGAAQLHARCTLDNGFLFNIVSFLSRKQV